MEKYTVDISYFLTEGYYGRKSEDYYGFSVNSSKSRPSLSFRANWKRNKNITDVH